MDGIDVTKFALRDPLAQHLAQADEDGLKVALDQLIEMRRTALARPHHFALHQPGIDPVRRDEIEIRARVGHNFLARRQVAVERAEHVRLQSGESAVEHRAVQRFFVFEVVVQQRLVDASFARDFLGAGTRDVVVGELLRRRFQDGRAALFRLPAGTHAAEMVLVTKQTSHKLLWFRIY